MSDEKKWIPVSCQKRIVDKIRKGIAENKLSHSSVREFLEQAAIEKLGALCYPFNENRGSVEQKKETVEVKKEVDDD